MDGDNVKRNLAYYVTAHFTQFVPPGSVHVAASEGVALPHVAFRTPSGGHVLVVSNTADAAAKFAIGYKGKLVKVDLPAGAVATYTW